MLIILSSLVFQEAISTKINRSAFANLVNAFGEVSDAFHRGALLCFLRRPAGAGLWKTSVRPAVGTKTETIAVFGIDPERQVSVTTIADDMLEGGR